MFAPVSILTTVPTLVVTRADSRFPDMKSAAGRSQGQARHGQHRPFRQRHHQPRRHPAPAAQRATSSSTSSPIAARARASPTCWRAMSTASPTSSPARCRTSSPASFGRWRASAWSAFPSCPTCRPWAISACKPFDGATTAGVFAHIDTPKAVIARLNEGVVAGLKDETANKRLRDLGAIVRPSTPEQFTAALKADRSQCVGAAAAWAC